MITLRFINIKMPVSSLDIVCLIIARDVFLHLGLNQPRQSYRKNPFSLTGGNLHTRLSSGTRAEQPLSSAQLLDVRALITSMNSTNSTA